VKRPARLDPPAVGLIVLGLVVSAGFTYLALRHVHLSEVWTGLKESNYWWVVPSVGLLLLALPVRALRWRVLFSEATRPPFLPVLSATTLGQFFNNVLPVRAGEAARVIALNRSARTSLPETVATVIVERVFDVLALLVILFVLLPWLPHVTWLRGAAVLAIVLVAATVAAAVGLGRYGDRPFRVLLRPLARLSFLSVERTDRAAASLVRGAVSLRQPRLAIAGLALTGISWVLLSLSTWVLMLGFDLHLSPLAGGLVTVAVGLSAIVPSSTAGVGVFETAVIVALGAYGVPKPQALSFALVLHAVNFFPYVAAGVVVLQAQALSWRAGRSA
jgi:glycosyltransferase 2 family protein